MDFSKLDQHKRDLASILILKNLDKKHIKMHGFSMQQKSRNKKKEFNRKIR